MNVQHHEWSRGTGQSGSEDVWTETIPTAVDSIGSTSIMGEKTVVPMQLVPLIQEVQSLESQMSMK